VIDSETPQVVKKEELAFDDTELGFIFNIMSNITIPQGMSARDGVQFGNMAINIGDKAKHNLEARGVKFKVEQVNR
jgi:hypothetical protein